MSSKKDHACLEEVRALRDCMASTKCVLEGNKVTECLKQNRIPEECAVRAFRYTRLVGDTSKLTLLLHVVCTARILLIYDLSSRPSRYANATERAFGAACRRRRNVVMRICDRNFGQRGVFYFLAVVITQLHSIICVIKLQPNTINPLRA